MAVRRITLALLATAATAVAAAEPAPAATCRAGDEGCTRGSVLMQQKVKSNRAPWQDTETDVSGKLNHPDLPPCDNVSKRSLKFSIRMTKDSIKRATVYLKACLGNAKEKEKALKKAIKHIRTCLSSGYGMFVGDSVSEMAEDGAASGYGMFVGDSVSEMAEDGADESATPGGFTETWAAELMTAWRVRRNSDRWFRELGEDEDEEEEAKAHEFIDAEKAKKLKGMPTCDEIKKHRAEAWKTAAHFQKELAEALKGLASCKHVEHGLELSKEKLEHYEKCL